MSAGKAIPLPEAAAVAGELVAALAPGCARIAIAGSIRRQKSLVHDVEIVAVPRIQSTDDGTLWGGSVDVDLLEEGVRRMLATGGDLRRREVTLHRADGSTEVSHRMGPRFKALVYRGLPVDLFIVRPPAEWGVVFALRTGPGDWNTRLVTDCQRFLRAVEGGARLRAAGRYVPCPEEEDFFDAIGQPWVDPPDRSVDRVDVRARIEVPA